jgi:hypothetical protein
MDGLTVMPAITDMIMSSAIVFALGVTVIAGAGLLMRLLKVVINVFGVDV